MTNETTDGRKYTQSLLRAMVQTDFNTVIAEARGCHGMQMEGVAVDHTQTFNDAG